MKTTAISQLTDHIISLLRAGRFAFNEGKLPSHAFTFIKGRQISITRYDRESIWVSVGSHQIQIGDRKLIREFDKARKSADNTKAKAQIDEEFAKAVLKELTQ